MKQKCYDLTDKQILLLLTVQHSNKTLKNRLNDLLKVKKKKKKRKIKKNQTKKIKIKESSTRKNKKNIRKIRVNKSKKKTLMNCL